MPTIGIVKLPVENDKKRGKPRLGKPINIEGHIT